jgi:isoquinoline 1-oxidoreductase beta subunit
MIDQLARKAGQDPVEYRRKLLGNDHPRHRAVLDLAADKAGWGKPLPKGRARGIALHKSFNSYVAEVAEVTLHDDNRFSVDRVVIAVDCGVAVNPDVIRAQMEGGMGYGLSPTLVSAITLNKGAVAQSNFHDYQMINIEQMPHVEVHIVNSAQPPTGVGEPGTPVIAPAVANALSALTGQAYQRLPLELTA